VILAEKRGYGARRLGLSRSILKTFFLSQHKEDVMKNKQHWFFAFALLALVAFNTGVKRAIAQSGQTDPRFEKLAKNLYPKAKQEGALVVYTIWDVEHARSILAAFNKRFPGINSTYWQGTRSEIITRTLTEFQGDQRTADVILSEGAPVVLRAAGAIEPYNTVQADSLLPRSDAAHG
jgi:hypothetical protein